MKAIVYGFVAIMVAVSFWLMLVAFGFIKL